MIRARSATMLDLRSSFSVLVIGLGLCVAPRVQAQNPPMNCTPDGIIEVCTPADSAAPIATDPASAPAAKVTYKGGLLTISAENVSLGDVLHEVSTKTGATIEFPNGSATEPVFTNIGPGPVRDILATLLNGTKFNYVMLGSENSSNALDKIVLTQGDQPTEVAESSIPNGAGQTSWQAHSFQKTQAAAGSEQTPEEKRAQFMQEVENMKAARMAEFEQKYAKMAADGLLRTPAPPSDSGSSPVANAPAESPAADSPASDSPNQ
jgi:hypothetical protein